MGKAKKTRKFAEVKRMLSPKDIKCVRDWHGVAARGGCCCCAAAAAPPPPLLPPLFAAA